MADYLSNGYVRFGPPISAVIRAATGVDFKGASGAQDIITLAGDVGATDGYKMGTLSVQSAVAQNSAERGRILKAFQTGQTVQAYYVDGGIVFVVTGTLKSVENSNKVNQPSEFSFELSGKLEQIQGAT